MPHHLLLLLAPTYCLYDIWYWALATCPLYSILCARVVMLHAVCIYSNIRKYAEVRDQDLESDFCRKVQCPPSIPTHQRLLSYGYYVRFILGPALHFDDETSETTITTLLRGEEWYHANVVPVFYSYNLLQSKVSNVEHTHVKVQHIMFCF